MLRVIQTADWHLSETNRDTVEPAIHFIVKEIQERQPDLVTIPGDLFVKRGFLTPTEIFTIRNAVSDIAAVCPVVIIPGNHDMTNHYKRVDSVSGVFRKKDLDKSIHENIHIANTYRRIDINLPGTRGRMSSTAVAIFCLPHPSKYIYMANAENAGNGDFSNINEQMAHLMEQILANVGVESKSLGNGVIPILIGHGTVKGGVSDSEMIMTTENDIAIDRSWLPAGIPCMYGHLHKEQKVGHAVYCGAIAPLTFAQENMFPVFLEWEISDDTVTYDRIPIPVAHQLLTLEFKPEHFPVDSDGKLRQDPNQTIIDRIHAMGVSGAKIRIKAEISPDIVSVVNKERIRTYLDDCGAYEHKLMIESKDKIRVRVDDIDKDLQMSAMLDKWAGLDEDRMAILPLMQEINTEVENSIPAADAHKLEGVDYELFRIKMVNFKPLIDVDIDFTKLGKIVCIHGENHAGKSQIAEAERFLFWKQLRKGTVLAQAVRLGMDSCTVTGWVASRGKEYKIIRMMKLSNKGIASGDLRFLVKSGDQWMPVNEGTATETQIALESIVGTYSMYRATRFGSQSEIDLLCGLTPAEMTDTIQEAMNTEQFDIRKTTAENMHQTLQAKHETSMERVDTLNNKLLDEDDLKKQTKEMTDQKVEQDIKIGARQKELTGKQDSRSEAKVAADKRLEIANSINSLSTEITSLKNEANDLKRIVDSEPRIKEGMAKLKHLRTDLDKKEKEIVGLREKVGKANSSSMELSKECTDLRNNISTFSASILAISNKIAEVNREFGINKRNLEQRILDARTTGGLTGEVPCADMDIQSQCKLLSHATNANTQADSLQKELDEMEPPDNSFDEQDKSQKEKASGELSIELKRKVDKIAELNLKNEDTNRELSLHEDDINTAKRNIVIQESNRWEQLEGKLDTSKKRLVAVDASIASKSTDKQEQLVKYEKMETLSNQYNMLILECVSLQEAIDSMNTQRDETVRRIGTLDNQLEEKARIRKEISEIEEAHKEGFKKLAAYNGYVSAVSRTGIPYLLLEKALPMFEQFANEFLCVDEGFDTPLRLAMTATKETQGGSSKDEVVIRFTDDRGTHPLGEASGFQRVAIGYALRASLSKLQAAASGAVIRHCIYDEGWGASDPKNQLLGKRMIQKFGEEFHRFLYITHIPTLQEVADSVIHVVSVSGGAQVEIR